MRKIPRVLTRHELSIVHDEGKKAFAENRQRGYNPYVSTNQELAMEWWHGWDTAKEEDSKPTRRPAAQL